MISAKRTQQKASVGALYGCHTGPL